MLYQMLQMVNEIKRVFFAYASLVSALGDHFRFCIDIIPLRIQTIWSSSSTISWNNKSVLIIINLQNSCYIIIHIQCNYACTYYISLCKWRLVHAIAKNFKKLQNNHQMIDVVCRSFLKFQRQVYANWIFYN